jgi:small-conductance mechanosensitive channel/CRP-like cAMP-binding protein
MNSSVKMVLGKIIGPLFISSAVFAFFYFGGDNYQAFGLAAVDSTRKALKYALGVVAFLSLAILAQRVIRYVIFDGLIYRATGTPVPRLLSQISGLIIYLIATSACAGIVFDQDLTVLWAASGVAGLVLGMALKELLQDVFAGIALNIDRAVRIGEYIRVHKAGDETVNGQLLEISWRTSRIRDFMGDVVILPNSKFSSCTVTNFSQPEPTSFRCVTVILDARVPQARAARILQAAALEALVELVGPAVAPPWVEVKAIKLEGVEYAIFYKAEWRHLGNAKPAVLQNILLHLAQAGLEPACPRQELVADPRRDGFNLPDAARLAVLAGAAELFRGLGEGDLRLLAAGARLRVEPSGRLIAQTGEAGTTLYLVLEGLLAAEADRRRASRSEFRPMLRPGDLFDPAVVLLGEAHAATVRTRTPVLLCEFSRELFAELFKASAESLPCIGRNLARLQAPKGQERTTAGIDHDDLADDVIRHIQNLFPEALSRRRAAGIRSVAGP